MTYDTDHFSLIYLTGYAFKHRIIYLVAEINVIEFNFSLNIKLNRIFCITDISFLVENFKYFTG